MRDRTPMISRCLAAAALVAALVVLDLLSPFGAAMMAPALALVAVVALGLFTGEASVSWLRRAIRRWRRRRPTTGAVAVPGAPARCFAAGIERAFALAMRPPPRAALSR